MRCPDISQGLPCSARACGRLITAALAGLLAASATAEPDDLWQIDAKAGPARGPVAMLPESARWSIGSTLPVQPGRLQRDAVFALPLADGRKALATAGDPVRHPNGDLSVRLTATAHRKSPLAASGMITTGRSGIYGRLRIDGRLWLVHSDAWGSWLIDASRPEIGVDAFGDDAILAGRSEWAEPSSTTSRTPHADVPGDDASRAQARTGSATVIDVMFIYPESMIERYPGDLLATRINHLVAIANQALADSGVPAVVRAVLQRPVGPLPTDENSEMLGLLSDALAGEFVPGLTNLAGLRDQFGADLVVLTWPHDIETRGSCGIAYFPRPAEEDPQGRYGVHITNDGVSNWSICSDAVFTHELGHNLNARHQRFEGDDPSLSNYAYVQLGRFNTVMGSFGTGDPNRFLRLDRFSAPDSLCGGGPCGSVEPGDEADNAAEIRRYLAQVAGYRGGIGTATAATAVDADSDGDGTPDSVDVYPLDPNDGQTPAPAPPPAFDERAARVPGDVDDYELLVVDSELDSVLAFNFDGSLRGEAARPAQVDDLPVLTEFSDLAVDDRGLLWLLASADVRRYDRANGELVDVFLDSERPEPRELLSAFPRALGFDPDGGLVVLGDSAIERYDEQGLRRTEPVPGDPGDPADWNTLVDLPLRAFAFGPDGRFYVAEGDRKRILVFGAATGERLPNLAFAGQLRDPRDLAFGADGRLYVADDTRIVRYDPLFPGQPTIFVPAGRGGLASARALAFGPDGDLFVVDRDRGGVLRFDAGTGEYLEETVPAGALSAPQALAIAPKLRALRPGHSGHWFDPERSGEGWLVEVLPNDRAAVLWFTYPAEGEEDEQLWLTGAGTVEDDRIVIPEMLRARGGRFGSAFDPDDVELVPWGALTLEFEDCTNGIARWTGNSTYGSGQRVFRRLAGIDGLPCEQAPRAAAASRPGLSGQWFDPSQAGQGWLLQEVRPGELFVAWFSYDENGDPAWMVGSGSLQGSTATFDSLLISRGTRFGEGFDAGDVILEDWGRATWTFESCSSSTISWTSDRAGFSGGQLQPVRLTRLDAIDCELPQGR